MAAPRGNFTRPKKDLLGNRWVLWTDRHGDDHQTSWCPDTGSIRDHVHISPEIGWITVDKLRGAMAHNLEEAKKVIAEHAESY